VQAGLVEVVLVVPDTSTSLVVSFRAELKSDRCTLRLVHVHAAQELLGLSKYANIRSGNFPKGWSYSRAKNAVIIA
jgi:hypothetical protein